MRVQAVTRSNLSTTITAQLRDMILNGELRPGEQLPGHRDLARMFGVSVTSIREAISALTAAGVLEAHAGLGTFVSRTPEPDIGSWAWIGRPTDRAEMLDLMEARGVLDRAIARFAAQRATNEQIDALRRVIAEMRRHITEPEKYLEADVTFHMTLATAAQNRTLLRAMYAIRAPLRRGVYLSLLPGLAQHGDARYTVESHESLVDAVARHDAAAAEAIAEQIVNRAASYLDEPALYPAVEPPPGPRRTRRPPLTGNRDAG